MKRSRIHLPALPVSWNRLSSEELEKVARYQLLREEESLTRGAQDAAQRFYVRCFLLFTGLKTRPLSLLHRQHTVEEDGETFFLFRRKGIRHKFEMIPIQDWQMAQWLEKLTFLDEPLGRFKSPYEFVRLFLKRFKGPSNVLSNITYLQYRNAETLLIQYWNSEGVIRELEKRNSSFWALFRAKNEQRKIKSKYLATLFNVASRETEVRTECSIRQVDRKIWAFDPNQINNWRYFYFASKRMFPVMLQYFQSVQEKYSQIFPDLFTNSEGKKRQNPLAMEANTMNEIKTFGKFSKYEDIYNSNAVFILDLLSRMNKYAKSIDAAKNKK